ncbi:MAG: hypothetical protein AB7I30_12060 [Isosphaeraceae bacterium]
MEALVPKGELETREDKLENWPAFSTAYYEPVRETLQILMRAPADEAHDAAVDFLLKAERNDYLGKFLRSRAEKEARKEPSRHRDYLFKALKHHVMDIYRRKARSKEAPLTVEAAEAMASEVDQGLDPDALYALLILHRALQSLRHHCERTNKPHLWVCFREILLAPEFRDGRPPRTLDELVADFPGKDKQFLHNSLTTAKRAFQRFVHEAIPRGFRDNQTEGSRFEDWMAILKVSNASQFNRLHIAYKVFPYIDPEVSQADSRVMDVSDEMIAYEEPSLVPTDDEMSLLLSFRLEMPLSETVDPADLKEYVPSESPLLPIRRGRSLAQTGRPFCLLSLVDPTPDEAEALREADVLGLLGRIKTLSKQLRRRPDQGMPEEFSQLLYTLASVVALVRHQKELHTIGRATLANNVRWFLKKPWFDDRLAPIFRQALELLDRPTNTQPIV